MILMLHDFLKISQGGTTANSITVRCSKLIAVSWTSDCDQHICVGAIQTTFTIGQLKL